MSVFARKIRLAKFRIQLAEISPGAAFAPASIGIGGGNFAAMDFADPGRAYWCEQRPDWAQKINEIKRLARQ